MPHYLADLGAAPGVTYPHLDAYWRDAARYPYLIVYSEEFVGFALVRQVADDPAFDLAEFYVAAHFRKHGFGRQAAEALFKLHPGAWSVGVLRSNTNAHAFWTSVLSSNPSVATADVKAPEGIVYRFLVRNP